jgi:hypothetical protein
LERREEEEEDKEDKEDKEAEDKEVEDKEAEGGTREEEGVIAGGRPQYYGTVGWGWDHGSGKDEKI